MKKKIILVLAVLLFGVVACSDVANPLSSDPSQEIGSGSSQNGSGSSQNGSGASQNG